MIRQERDSLISRSLALINDTRTQNYERLLTAALLRGSEDIAFISISTSQPETGWLIAQIAISISRSCYKHRSYPVSNTNLMSCFS
jgi:hypothetical protein